MGTTPSVDVEKIKGLLSNQGNPLAPNSQSQTIPIKPADSGAVTTAPSPAPDHVSAPMPQPAVATTPPPKPPLRLESLSQTSGRAGDTLKLSGEGFTDRTVVEFASEKANILSASSREITLQIPVNVAGNVAVKAFNGSEASGAPQLFQILPVIYGFINLDFAKPGEYVHIKGSGFTPDSRVEFSGKAEAKIGTVTPQQLSVILPAQAQTGPVTVTVPNGQAQSLSFKVDHDLLLKALDKQSGKAGDILKLTGSGFSAHGTPEVFFDQQKGSLLNITAEELSVQVPKEAAGKAAIVVKAGPKTSSKLDFSVLPLISFLSSNTVKPGDTLVINGTGFSLTGTEVKFNETKIDLQSVTATQIFVKVPCLTGQTAVTVSTPGGKAVDAVTIDGASCSANCFNIQYSILQLHSTTSSSSSNANACPQ